MSSHNDHIFVKSLPKKKTKKRSEPMTPFEESLRKETIVDRNTDLAKLLFTLKLIEVWPQDIDLKTFVVEKVLEFFDGSGEMATHNCLEVSQEYGFIVLYTDPKTGDKRFKECPKNKLDSSHDWFCFYCDSMIGEKSRQYLKCQTCSRIFHRKCAEEYHKIKDYFCSFCERVQQKDCYFDYKMVDKKGVNQLIVHYMDFVKNKMTNKYQKCVKKIEGIFIFKTMDLSLIRQKADRQQYNCLEEFDDDFFFFMHNLSVTETHVEDIAQSFLDLRSEILKELAEIKKCVDCYQRLNDKQLRETNKEWLSLPCAKTHEPVFVKMKGFPYWPAKVIEVNENNKIEVCFFEPEKSKDKRKGSPIMALKREVSKREVKLLSDEEAFNSIKVTKDQRLIKSMVLFIRYLELMPNNDSYMTSIEKLKQIKFESNESPIDSIDDTIESVVNQSFSKKTSLRNRVTTKTPSNPTPFRPTSSKGQQHSAIKQVSSNASTRSSSPSVPPVLEMMSDSNDSVQYMMYVVNDFPKMDISEGPPALERQDLTQSSQLTPNQLKRRSERIAKTTPQKKESENKTPSKESSTKISHQIKDSDESELMDVEDEENRQKRLPIKLVVDIPVSMSEEFVLQIDVQKNKENKQNIDLNSESNQSKNTSVLKPSTNYLTIDSTQKQNIEEIVSKPFNQLTKSQTESIETIAYMSNNVTKKDSLITSKSSETTITDTATNSTTIITTSPTTPLMSSQESTSSASITTETLTLAPMTTIAETSTSAPMISTPSTVITSEVIPSIVTPPIASTSTYVLQNGINSQNSSQSSFNGNVSNRFDQIMTELKSMEGPMISKEVLEEKLILLDYHHKRQLNEQLVQLKLELRDSKTKNWCAVCQNVATLHCCVRTYCSINCQIEDWKRGHKQQCVRVRLTQQKNKP